MADKIIGETGLTKEKLEAILNDKTNPPSIFLLLETVADSANQKARRLIGLKILELMEEPNKWVKLNHLAQELLGEGKK